MLLTDVKFSPPTYFNPLPVDFFSHWINKAETANILIASIRRQPIMQPAAALGAGHYVESKRHPTRHRSSEF
jgi:hypothetical protein